MRLVICVLLVFGTLGPLPAAAATAASPAAAADTAATKNASTQQEWGVGAAMRGATIPFATESKKVSSFVPLIFFEGDRFFFRGLEGGVRFWRPGDWSFSVLGRLRFFDIPEEFQNEIQGDTADWGLQARYQPLSMLHFDLEALADWNGHSHYNARGTLLLDTGRARIRPFAEMRYKTGHYNSFYYGLQQEEVGGDIDLALGATVNYHLTSSLYLWGAVKSTHLGRQVRGSTLVDDTWHHEIFLGGGLSNNPDQPAKRQLRNRRYLRFSHGWATPSSLAEIMHFEAAKDPYNNQLSTVFYGHPLTDELFGLPLDVYLHSGFGWHWKSAVQDHAQELIVAIKLYYTVPWPIRWKLGAAEGFSWVNEIPYVEKTEIGKKGYKPSNLLNYLDFSVDLNIGDLLPGDGAEDYWLGYYIHHRSAIFESAQHFGRIKGGSNFQMIYLQRDF